MKMLINGLESDAYAISRIPTPSPPCTKMEEVDPRCAAPPPARPVQVHPHRHHAEDGAVAECVDGVDAVEQKAIKNSELLLIIPVPCVANVEAPSVANVEAPWPLNANANAPPLDVGVRVKGGAVPFMVDFKKGFNLLTDKDLWKTSSKAEIKSAKQRVADYKHQYRASGTRDSYNQWLVKKGYAKKTGCCLM